MAAADTKPQLEPTENPNDPPHDVEMTLTEHLEELRWRIFASLLAIAVACGACFIWVRPLVAWLEAPAGDVRFLQLAPGEFFFVSFKVAALVGVILVSPFILYQVIQFILPGLTRRERDLLGPAVLGSSVLFFTGLAFSHWALVPAALSFFISYGGDVVEQAWSIESYFDFVLLLMFCTGLVFQVPVLQYILANLGIVSSNQMLKTWRYVILLSVVLGAILTPSTDPITQSLLAGAVLCLYFGGIGVVKALGK
ncbi:twin-arginine translocase subunit TatC [Spirulina sp. CCNP1310]|uniref:twin-arginine translocase subunit TatC n=1 Tax=Spirulina sp. CCNP1310 TaxID=3110249 RepID=UPI002B1EF623|nr:twin-arginine translocase subunit TatC [Spirulina sp. CCNP1310]MEA5420594.1 twin-arginine translocase subunit TatC [Spirulina sp. CCNP1310]